MSTESVNTKSVALKEKALSIIDCICAEQIEFRTKFEHDSEGNITGLKPDTLRELFERLYEIAHAASDTSCSHPEWETKIEQTYTTLKERGIL
jgi:hypothetical protein